MFFQIPDEVWSEVLSCLDTSQIAAVAMLNRANYQRVHDMGCVSSQASFRKPVSLYDFYTKYNNHFILAPVPLTAGVVTLRCLPIRYNSTPSRKFMIQLLALAEEHSAARWLARQGGHAVPAKSSCPHLFLYQQLHWEFLSYTMLCKAIETSTSEAMRLHIRSLPGITDGERRLKASPQPFLCNVLWHTRHKLVILKLQGTPEVSTRFVSRAWIQEERRKVDALFEQSSWGERIRLFQENSFKSSTIGLGMVFATVRPRLKFLHMSHYVFDEQERSLDARYLMSWLSNNSVQQTLVRVHLDDISFVYGEDYSDMLQGLCRVETLRHLCLSNIDYCYDAPVDPAAILFEHGVYIKELRMIRAARPLLHLPFHLLVHTAFSTLKLSRMFIESGSIHYLTSVLSDLPHLTTLDLSCNGIDGAVLMLLSAFLGSTHCQLERLNLSTNAIASNYVAPFCKALCKNTSLRALHLSDNFLGTQSSLHILQAMLRSGGLRTLYLDSNQIRVTMEELYAELQGETPGMFLRQISMRHNPIHESSQHLATHKALFKEMFGISFIFH